MNNILSARLRETLEPNCSSSGFLTCQFIAKLLIELSMNPAEAWAFAHGACEGSADGEVHLEALLHYLFDVELLSPWNKDFILSAMANGGNEDDLITLIQKDMARSLEVIDDDGHSLALLAARGGYAKCLRLLAESRADLETTNHKGYSAAMLAAWRGKTACLHLLATFKAELDMIAKDKTSAAGLAARCGRTSCLRFLIEHSVDLTVRGRDGSTLVAFSAVGGHLDCLNYLINCHADFETPRDDGSTPLLLAARWGHLGCLRSLTRQKANLAARSKKNGRTIAILAAHNGNVQCLNFLVGEGADFAAKDSNGTSVAMFYLLDQKRLLLLPGSAHVESNSDYLVKLQHGTTMQRLASTENHLPSKGTDPSAEVLEAAERGNVQRLRALAYTGANFNGRSGSGATPTILAARGGHAECVHMLLMHRADLEDTDQFGGTATIAATRNGHTSCLRVLINLRANLECRDNYGHTPCITSARCGHLENLQLLIDLHANLEAKRYEGLDAVLDAASSGHESCLGLLIARKASLEKKTNVGRTALSLAANAGHEKCVEMLVQHGADLLEKDGAGQRPIQLLSRKNLTFLDTFLPHYDWPSIAADGIPALSQFLIPACSTGSSNNSMVSASLHHALWRSPGEPRDPNLSRSLKDALHTLLQHAGEQQFGPSEQPLLILLLKMGVLAIDENRAATESVVDCSFALLQAACDERQAALGLVASCTAGVNTIYPHMTRFGTEAQSELDQRDAMPEELWKWVECNHRDSCDALHDAFKAFQHTGVIQTTTEFSGFLREQNLTSDHALFATGVPDLLVAYAKSVNIEFQKLMRRVFGDAFLAAPLKRKPRMLEKVAADLKETFPEFPGFGHETVFSNVAFRTAFFDLADIVRGSITVDGAEAMLATKKQLHELTTGIDGVAFEVWRIKNCHHPDAETVGGYRDMKIIGRLTAPAPKMFMAPLSMLVEVQILDQQFLEIKRYMHKVYAVKRGDFWEY